MQLKVNVLYQNVAPQFHLALLPEVYDYSSQVNITNLYGSSTHCAISYPFLMILNAFLFTKNVLNSHQKADSWNIHWSLPHLFAFFY